MATVPVLKKRPNIVWFMVDALRSEYLMEFIRRKPDDFLSKFILSGVAFDTVISTAPCTAPSNYSCMTGLYPIMTGIASLYMVGRLPNYHQAYNKMIISFPEILKGEGYFNIFIHDGHNEIIPPS